MVEKILMDIGLTEGEARVYASLNKLGLSTIGPILEESGISRSKIYDVLDRLQKKGLVSHITKNKTKHFEASDPSKIKELLAAKEEKIKRDIKEIDKALPFLFGMRGKGKEASSVQVYEGFQGIMTAHDHVFPRLKKGQEYFFFGINSFQEERYHATWKKAHTRRVRLGIACRLLFNAATPKNVMRNRNKYKYCDARYMPVGMETPAWVMGYADVTLIGLQSKKGMAIKIINKEIADSFRSYFEMLWNLSHPFKQ